MRSAPVKRAAFLGRRLLAVVLDSLLYSAALFPVMYAVFGADYFNSQRLSSLSPFSLDGLILIAFDDLIPALLLVFCWFRWGATPGKFLMGLRVIDANSGGPISLGQSVARLFGYIVSMLALFLGFAWAIWDKRCRGWHDYIARTLVVDEAGYESLSLKQLVEGER